MATSSSDDSGSGMDPDTQHRYRAVLEAVAADLRGRLTSDHEACDPVSPDRAIGRLSRVEAMQAQQLSLAVHRRTQQRLQRVEHALRLIGEGHYGSCTTCGEDIDTARLDVSPDTFVCVPCLDRLQGR